MVCYPQSLTSPPGGVEANIVLVQGLEDFPLAILPYDHRSLPWNP
jgi:hypothetical protein